MNKQIFQAKNMRAPVFTSFVKHPVLTTRFMVNSVLYKNAIDNKLSEAKIEARSSPMQKSSAKLEKAIGEGHYSQIVQKAEKYQNSSGLAKKIEKDGGVPAFMAVGIVGQAVVVGTVVAGMILAGQAHTADFVNYYLKTGIVESVVGAAAAFGVLASALYSSFKNAVAGQKKSQ